MLIFISLHMKFQKISVSRYHVCGIIEGVHNRTLCWGRRLNIAEQISLIEEAKDKATETGIKIYSWDEFVYREKKHHQVFLHLGLMTSGQ